MQDPSTMDYAIFKDTIINSLNRHAPLKRKYLRANHLTFIMKELSKAITQRSKLRNLYLETELGIRSKEIFVCHYLEKLKERSSYGDLSSFARTS